MNNKIKILCLDIEGGHGGSSKSLFYLLQKINKKKFNIKVICRRNSWLVAEYEKNHIKCEINKSIPKYVILKKFSINFFYLIYFFINLWPKSSEFREKLVKDITKNRYDILHCNHINLFFLAIWLKKKIPNLKITFHIRTIFLPTKYGHWHIFFKLAVKSLLKACDYFIFISENEKKNIEQILKKKVKGMVIYNPVIQQKNNKNIKLKKKSKLKIVSLSNHDLVRGADRIIEVATFIPKKIRKKFIFLMIGDYLAKPSIFEKLTGTLNIKKNLVEYAKIKRVNNMFKFYGHLKKPENIIKKSDLMIKLSRIYNPWGRDVLEAMSFGKPSVSCGTYKKFIKTNITGLLQKEYDPKKIARWLIEILNNKKKYKKMSKNCIKISNNLCSQKNQSKKTEAIWINIISSKKKEIAIKK